MGKGGKERKRNGMEKGERKGKETVGKGVGEMGTRKERTGRRESKGEKERNGEERKG